MGTKLGLALLALASTAFAASNCIEGKSTYTPHGLEKPVYLQCRYDQKLNANFDLLDTWYTAGLASRAGSGSSLISATIQAPVYDDVGIPMPWIASEDTTLTSFTCRYEGSCTDASSQPLTFFFKTDAGTLIQQTANQPCATGSAAAVATPLLSTSNLNQIAAGHGFRVLQASAPTAACRFATVSVLASATSASTPTSTTAPAGATTTTTTSTVSTFTTSTILLDVDGPGTYQAGDSLLASAARYYGGNLRASTATQSDIGNFWITSRRITNISSLIRVHNSPGTVWQLKLEYLETPPPIGSSCSDMVGSLVSTSLGGIGAGLSDRFAVDLLTQNSGLGIPAGGCFHVKFQPGATPTAAGGAGVGLLAYGADGGSLMTLASGTNTLSAASPKILGPQGEPGPTNVNYWNVPRTMASCSGAVSLSVPPGAGMSWTYGIRVSTAPKDATHACDTLTYTTVPGCTLSDTNKTCTFPLTAITAPVGHCIAATLVATGTPASTAQTWSLDCSPDAADPTTAGATAFVGTEGGNLPLGEWFAGPDLATSDATPDAMFWTNGAQALTKCSGAFGVSGLGSGGGQYNIGLRYTTQELAASETCSHFGEFLSWAEVPLCTSVFGSPTGAGCSFSDVTVAIPPNACVQLHSTTTGTASVAKGTGSWLVECRK